MGSQRATISPAQWRQTGRRLAILYNFDQAGLVLFTGPARFGSFTHQGSYRSATAIGAFQSPGIFVQSRLSDVEETLVAVPGADQRAIQLFLIEERKLDRPDKPGDDDERRAKLLQSPRIRGP